jgi:hypothetical protein
MEAAVVARSHLSELKAVVVKEAITAAAQHPCRHRFGMRSVALPGFEAA